MDELISFFSNRYGKPYDDTVPSDIIQKLNGLDRAERGELKDLLFNEARKLELRKEEQSVIFWLQNCFHTVEFHSFRMHKVFFSPGSDIMENLGELLSMAQHSIDLCVFTITDSRLGEKIIDKHRKGVQVRIITDDRKTFDNGSEIAHFRQAGIPVKIDHSRYHMHNKFGIIDGRIAFTGSFNWTYTASEHNQENLLVTTNFDIVREYREEFMKLWQEMHKL